MANTYTEKDWQRDGTLKVEVGQMIEPAVYYQLRGAVPPVQDGFIFQVGEPYTYDMETGVSLYSTFERTARNLYKYIGLKPAYYSPINQN